jgi:hypothetical protein
MAFVWTKMQSEGGASLAKILALKEAERIAGKNVFWWGIGNPLDQAAVCKAARAANGTLPILFSRMHTPPQKKDAHPDRVLLWTEWEDPTGRTFKLPAHIFEWSRGYEGKRTHYALVCRSSERLEIGDHGPFDPKHCQQEKSGKTPASIQVTALLRGSISMEVNHYPGCYREGFRATLIEPWFVRLVNPRPLDASEQRMLQTWSGEEWQEVVDRLRDGNSN